MRRIVALTLFFLPIFLFGQKIGQKKAAPVPSFTVAKQVCVGDTVVFTNTSNTKNVHYDFGDGTDTRKEHPRHIYKEAGSFLVIQTAYLDGTAEKFEFTIEVKGAPKVTLTYSRDAREDTVEMYIGENVTITAAESYPTYKWLRKERDDWAEKADGNPSYTASASGEYKLFSANDLGCSSETLFWIITNEKEDDPKKTTIIVVNNVLTPNSDSFNDVLLVKYLDNPDIYEEPLLLNIYSKSGVLVYMNDNYANDWNGIDSGGAELPTGTYYYLATSKGRISKSGFIDIIRSE